MPCYNEEEVLVNFYQVVSEIMVEKMQCSEYEIIFVDDGSKDNTHTIISTLARENQHVEYISFSRNFGKESAMYAGLKYADGEYTIIMDADLQHPPKYIPLMLEKMETGNYDMIATRRKKRGNESKIRSFLSEQFYHIMNRISGIDMGDNALDYRMFNKKAKEAVLNLAEYNRFSKGIFEWIGYRTYWMEIEIDERAAGQSKWSFKKLVAYSIEGCLAFSTVPLYLSSMFGLLFCVIAFMMIVVMVVQAIMYGIAGTGFTTIICLILLIGGIILFCQGILGQYLAKDYLENKKRPIFLIQDMSKVEKDN